MRATWSCSVKKHEPFHTAYTCAFATTHSQGGATSAPAITIHEACGERDTTYMAASMRTSLSQHLLCKQVVVFLLLGCRGLQL